VSCESIRVAAQLMDDLHQTTAVGQHFDDGRLRAGCRPALLFGLRKMSLLVVVHRLRLRIVKCFPNPILSAPPFLRLAPARFHLLAHAPELVNSAALRTIGGNNRFVP
jgi:hypothetical protein